MSRVVEFCGVPGSGKSTIYKEVVKRRNKGMRWVPAPALYPTRKVSLSNPALFAIEMIKMLTGGGRTFDKGRMMQFTTEFVRNHATFFDYYWTEVFTREGRLFNGFDTRTGKAYFLVETLFNVTSVLKNSRQVVGLLDEGLVQRVSGTRENHAALLNTLPLPDGVILVDTAVEVIVDRISSRKKVVGMFQELSGDALLSAVLDMRKALDSIVSGIQEKGTPVLRIDSSEVVRLNADKVLQFLTELS